jgi:N-acetylmuramoyl-L-alanine amidase
MFKSPRFWLRRLLTARASLVLSMTALVCGLVLLPCASALAADVDVWIDPGHGGSAPGAPGFDQASPYREKQATLEVSTSLLGVLGQTGFSAFMTRYGDEDVPLERRAAMASGTESNSAAEQGVCQLFISIHMNSVASAQPFGTEMWYSPVKVNLKDKTAFRTDSTWARTIFAKLIQNTPAAFMGCNSPRDVLPAKHIVTKEATVPSTLIEVCFISNQCQQNHIRAAGNQGFVAAGIAAGVSDVITPGGLAQGSRSREVAPASQDSSPARPWIRFGPELQGPYRLTATQAYNESFDEATFPPAGWTVTSLGQPAPFFWSRIGDPIYVHSGSGATVVRGGSTGAIDEWLISPKLFLGPTDRGLNFYWLGNKRWAAQVDGQCLVRPVGSSTWTPLWALQSETPGQEFEYRQRVVDLSPWLGDSVQVAFRAVGTNGADFAVDDVAIGNFAPAPVAPVNETCASAASLPAGHFNLAGATCSAANDLDPYKANSFSCTPNPLSGGDVFYRVTAQSADTLDVNIAANWQAAVYLVAACDTAVGSCLAASPENELTDTSSVATLHYVFASGGTYYLAVDGIAGDCGGFHLTGALHGPVTGTGDQGPADVRVFRLTASPNPAPGAIRFAGQLPPGRRGTGVLRVFDAAGRLVFQRVTEVSGNRVDVWWDGHDQAGAGLPGGVYLARFQLGGESSTTQFVLVK